MLPPDGGHHILMVSLVAGWGGGAGGLHRAQRDLPQARNKSFT